MNPQPSMIRIFLFSPFLLFYVLSHPLHAFQPRALLNDEVIVLFEEPLKGAAEETASIFPGIKRELESTLRLGMNFRPTVILVKKREVFHKMAGSDRMVAFAVPGRNLIVIDHSKMKTHPFNIEITLKHELCHLLLHYHIRGEYLPKWLNEGIAQWVSGGIPEIIMDQKRSSLHEALLSGRTIRIRSLTNRFPSDNKFIRLAYEESKSLVEYIISRFGVDGMLAVLKYLKEGHEVDSALLKGLSISLDELENDWLKHLKRKMNWLTYLIHHLYESLFFLGALIMIYAFIRRLIQKRASYRNE